MEDGLSLDEIRSRSKQYLPQTPEYGRLTNCAFGCLHLIGIGLLSGALILGAIYGLPDAAQALTDIAQSQNNNPDLLNGDNLLRLQALAHTLTETSNNPLS